VTFTKKNLTVPVPPFSPLAKILIYNHNRANSKSIVLSYLEFELELALELNLNKNIKFTTVNSNLKDLVSTSLFD
jgi:hypothetical protein